MNEKEAKDIIGEGFQVYEISIMIVPEGIAVTGVRRESVYQMMSPDAQRVVNSVAQSVKKALQQAALENPQARFENILDKTEEDRQDSSDNILDSKVLEEKK